MSNDHSITYQVVRMTPEGPISISDHTKKWHAIIARDSLRADYQGYSYRILFHDYTDHRTGYAD